MERLRCARDRVHDSKNDEWEKYKRWTRRTYDDPEMLQDMEEDNLKHEVDSESEDDDQEDNVVLKEMREESLIWERGWLSDYQQSDSS